VAKHPELETVKMFHSSCTDLGLMVLLETCAEVLACLNIQHSSIKLSNIVRLNVVLPALKELRLSGDLDETGLASLLNKVAPTLRILNLRASTNVFSEMSSVVATFTHLEELNLGCCTNLTDEALISLLNKLGQRLKILHLDYTNISLSKTSSLHISFSCLETLNLFGSSGMEESETEILSRNIDEAGLAMLLNKIGDNLKVLNLGFTSVTLSGIHSVTRTFPRLEAVNLTHCTKITVDGLKLFLNRFGGCLRSLNLSSTCCLDGLSSLADPFSRLEVLDLEGSNVTDSLLASILNVAGASLRRLILSRTGITLYNICPATVELPLLVDLVLAGCTNLTFNCPGLFSLLAKAPRLKTLDIGLTSLSVENVETQFPDLAVLKDSQNVFRGRPFRV